MALFVMGNARQHMAQERRKHVFMNLNPALQCMANDEKSFMKTVWRATCQIGDREDGPS